LGRPHFRLHQALYEGTIVVRGQEFVLAFFPSLLSFKMLPCMSAWMSANSPIWRWNATCGSFISNLMPIFSITLFQRPMPLLVSPR